MTVYSEEKLFHCIRIDYLAHIIKLMCYTTYNNSLLKSYMIKLMCYTTYNNSLLKSEYDKVNVLYYI